MKLIRKLTYIAKCLLQMGVNKKGYCQFRGTLIFALSFVLNQWNAQNIVQTVKHFVQQIQLFKKKYMTARVPSSLLKQHHLTLLLVKFSKSMMLEWPTEDSCTGNVEIF